MSNSFYQSLLLLTACLAAPAAMAQTFSYDGNRWYEIEVSIFSNEGVDTSSELVIPDKTPLAYPQPILQLEPAVSSFLLDFDEGQDEIDKAPLDAFFPAEFGLLAELVEEPLMIGPEPAPAASGFRMRDFRRDPYIALGSDASTFSRYNQRIANSPEHRLLYHAVWRQPVLNRVQATAIFVAGGDQYGLHHELEGSLRFSFNVNRVDVETNLWMAAFSAFPAINAGATPWKLPAPPFRPGDSTLTLDLPVTRLGYMDQVRPMISNELHYLDHPDIGMLVQIRPYELPQPVEFTFE